MIHKFLRRSARFQPADGTVCSRSAGKMPALQLKKGLSVSYWTCCRVILVLLLLLAPLAAQQTSPDQPDYVVVLDVNGTRGIVFFNHPEHVPFVNPDPAYPFKAEKSATCSGCHHTVSATGVIQLWSCRSCHGYEGVAQPVPVRSKMFADDAFHGTCISCHRAQKKGPVLCSGCHKALAGL